MAQTISYELTRAWAYRRISHRRMWIYTRALPLVLTTVVGFLWLALPEKPNLVGGQSISSSALAIIATLPGFYFAGLAAVATFGGSGMDKIMPAPAPTLKTAVSNGIIDNELSNRQFLSYLFSYLVFVSFVLCIILLIFSNFGQSIELLRKSAESIETYGKVGWLFLSAATSLAVLSLAASMIISTLHAVFFLTEKIHQP
ncbi:hypothetical protein PFY01_15220 [Brevundimonas vesicularis]|uniref:hypothetical protein n=1 Tax=Brevundimonas vesicularis TaxID=41276 RepID=UPI0022EC49DF|nr:hypothetical protein [Brevundimonas vesicularis]WBT06040.1 hypothetical protein PFY01_15220 [Brevundimonas vesicularis]